MREVYLKLTEDEVDDVLSALYSQNEFGTSNAMNYDTSDTDALMAKISDQKDGRVRRPFVVDGVHKCQMMLFNRRVIVMAEDAESAIEYSKEHVEKEDGGEFVVNPSGVHEMADDEVVVVEVR